MAVDLALRIDARIGHPSAKAALAREIANDPPPPSEPIVCLPSLKRVANAVPPGPNYRGHVYVIGFADYVKIGWSLNVAWRLFELQKHAPEKLVLYKLISANQETERELHLRFEYMRLHGEWFALAKSLKIWVEDGCPFPWNE